MKKITLLAILIFFAVFTATVVGSQFTTKTTPVKQKKLNSYTTSQPTDNTTNSGTGQIPTGIMDTKNNYPNIPDALYHIKSPNINIGALIAQSSKPISGNLTLTEISKHNSKNDCYLVINNNVYNVSSYISYHPGGSRTITSRCGQEVTGIFASIHSNRAWDLLKRYKIGSIGKTTKQISTDKILSELFDALAKANPQAEVIRIKPKKDLFVAKIIYKGRLYEVHIDNNGQIIKEEIEDDEFNWSLWDSDNDDK